jgi:hypothetical protein
MTDIGRFNDARFDFVTVPEKRWWGGTKNKTYMVLREPLVYTYDLDGETYRLTVEAGYPSDGASIPSGAIWLSDKLWFTDKIESFGIHWPATFFHDRIWDDENPLPEGFCQRLDKATGEWVNMPNTKPNGKKVWDFKASNKLFARQLRELGASKGTRRTMYHSVNSFIGRLNYWF